MSYYKYKVIVVGDFHIPFHDDYLIKESLKTIKEVSPDIIVINGDFLDFMQLSSFDKNPKFYSYLNKDIKIGKEILSLYRKAAPKSKIYYVVGNHDGTRLQKFINENTAFFELEQLSLPHLLDLKSMNIYYIDKGDNNSYIKIGNCYIGHFNCVRKHSAMTAKALVEEYGVNIIQSHTHRGGIFYKRLMDKTLVGAEALCMCSKIQPYTNTANWQFGFLEIDIQSNKLPKIKTHIFNR